MKTIQRVTAGMAEAYARLELRFEALLRVSSTVVSLHLFSADHLALPKLLSPFRPETASIYGVAPRVFWSTWERKRPW